MVEIGDTRARLLAAARRELTEHAVSGISLRAIARRAEVSHAAPKYFFGDRAGLLTAVATEGFEELTRHLEETAGRTGPRLGTLGRAYIDFGLREPELFDLMFRPAELHPDDAALREAQTASLRILTSAVTPDSPSPSSAVPTLTLISWAFAHGVVALLREGALQSVDSAGDIDALTDQLVTTFERALG